MPAPSMPPDASAGTPLGPDTAAVVQLKVWLHGTSPMVWRRLQVPDTCTLRELHGILQVAMGWEGVHLYQFCLRSRRYGSWELAASSPDVTLAALRLRRGTRFTYEYDLNIPWRHEVRFEESRLEMEPGGTCPRCTGGGGACPPEDCGGPGGYMAGLDGATSLAALEDLEEMADVLRAVVLERRPEVLDEQETRWRLEDAVERAQGRPFSRRSVNVRLRKRGHLELMHQQC